MKIIKQFYDMLEPICGVDILKKIERSGRTCYKSEDKITSDSARKFVKKILDSGHHSVIEHCSATIRFITDRGVTHELVRHRLVSYSQESTRYCNYSKDKFGAEITVILPVWFYEIYGVVQNHDPMILDEDLPMFNQYVAWRDACALAESKYFKLLELGQSPQQARSVLPNSLKTEIVTTANLREWRHILKLRTSEKAHPQIVDLMKPLLQRFKEEIPILFDDI